MSAKAGMPTGATVFLVPGYPDVITDETEAREKAAERAHHLQKPVELLKAVIPLDGFQVCDTINPSNPLPINQAVVRAEVKDGLERLASREPNPLAINQAVVRAEVKDGLERLASREPNPLPINQAVVRAEVKDGLTSREPVSQAAADILNEIGAVQAKCRTRKRASLQSDVDQVTEELRAAGIGTEYVDAALAARRSGLSVEEFGKQCGLTDAECEDVPPDFAVGDAILFLYPKHPFFGLKSILEPQFIHVDKIRDLMETPADRSEGDNLQIMSRFMIHGTRIDTGAPCVFAWEIMKAVQSVEVRKVPKPLTRFRTWNRTTVRPTRGKLSNRDLERLIKFVKGGDFEALFVLALTSGMRQGELLALEWDDIDLVGNTLHVSKSVYGQAPEIIEAKSEREIELDASALQALLAHRQSQLEHGYDGKVVFPAPDGGAMSKDYFDRLVWDDCRSGAMLDGFRFGDLRTDPQRAATVLSYYDFNREVSTAATA